MRHIEVACLIRSFQGRIRVSMGGYEFAMKLYDVYDGWKLVWKALKVLKDAPKASKDVVDSKDASHDVGCIDE